VINQFLSQRIVLTSAFQLSKTTERGENKGEKTMEKRIAEANRACDEAIFSLF